MSPGLQSFECLAGMETVFKGTHVVVSKISSFLTPKIFIITKSNSLGLFISWKVSDERERDRERMRERKKGEGEKKKLKFVL